MECACLLIVQIARRAIDIYEVLLHKEAMGRAVGSAIKISRDNHRQRIILRLCQPVQDEPGTFLARLFAAMIQVCIDVQEFSFSICKLEAHPVYFPDTGRIPTKRNDLWRLTQPESS